jgi:hypothetical protein
MNEYGHYHVTVYYPCGCIKLRAVRYDDTETLKRVDAKLELSEPFMCDTCRSIKPTKAGGK